MPVHSVPLMYIESIKKYVVAPLRPKEPIARVSQATPSKSLLHNYTVRKLVSARLAPRSRLKWESIHPNMVYGKTDINEMTFSSVVAAPTVLRAATATAVHNLCRSLKVTSRVINVTLNAVFCHMVLDNTSA